MTTAQSNHGQSHPSQPSSNQSSSIQSSGNQSNGSDTWDTLIINALLFDGSGAMPQLEDLAIKEGKVAARGQGLAAQLSADSTTEIVDAGERWLMPGLLDIHTHLDLEVEVNPGLGEAVRHGSTSVVVGNCSLGTAFGAQLRNGESPVLDCFARVENMPKRVLQKCQDKMTWHNTADYLTHFQTMPLGPNIAPLIPHSMLRIEVMGVDASVNRAPTESEREQMEALLNNALDQGYIGFSTDGIIFHYMANDPNKDKYVPSQYADDRELKGLTDILRRRDRVWQTTPNSQKMGQTLKRFFWSGGRFRKKPLRVSALVALDFNPMPGTWKSMLLLARVINSFLFKGHFHFQALSTNFRMWGNGIQSPVFEELPSTRALIACEVEDGQARQQLMNDPQWQAQFYSDWKKIEPNENRKRRPGAGETTFELIPELAMMDDQFPLQAWRGKSLAFVFDRFNAWCSGALKIEDKAESDMFSAAPEGNTSLADFFLHCLRTFDLDFRWWVDVANSRPEVTKKILFDKNTLPGFNDSGAHITNLAFYDGNLLTLQFAQQDGLEKVAIAVKRLTRDPAEFFGLDVGTLQIGAQADITLVNPEVLKGYDSNSNRQMVYHEIFEQDVLVNRSDGVVEQVYIRGTRVWEDGARFTPALGRDTLGRALTSVR